MFHAIKITRRKYEQELLDGFDEAIRFGHIFMSYQPKINHCTGRMIGAEALMRWEHPVYGMQRPSDFIPVLEKNNLIFYADLAAFESVCKFQRSIMDSQEKAVPISVNMSRHDIYGTDYVDEIEKLREKYDIPVEYIRIELTESSAIGGVDLVSRTLKQLHESCYFVELDDFGSAYSSLNILKDLEVDALKLDMRFFCGDHGDRGGIILNSVVQMAKWLQTPVIVEGVETHDQSTFLKSIGCRYVQGFLYSKPVPAGEFRQTLKQIDHEPISASMNLIKGMDAGRFWDPSSLETLIFNNFAGSAAVFIYQNDTVEVQRVNEKCIKELGMNIDAQDIFQSDFLELMDETDRGIYKDTLMRAAESSDEESCETWLTIHSKNCGEDKICIRSHIRMIGNTDQQYLFYSIVQNVTAEKKAWDELYHSERRFRFASEQASVYAWEYNISTKEMHPCYRCMRDLHLPPVVRNYPEPAIEDGIFPPDYADMYREWIRMLDRGEVDSLEGIIPLTVGRVPFHVRYTLERDESGNPLKAYGSATLVVDGEEKET